MKLFSFDVRLQDLMSLQDYAQQYYKLNAVFVLLRTFWYTLPFKDEEQKRWDTTRVGSIDVSLDENNHLHLEFVTRFSLNNYPAALEVLNKLNENHHHD